MKFSLSDWIVTALSAAAATALLVFFVQDLNSITSHGDDPALGTITFRKQTATRRSAVSQVWERLQNQSPVYPADTLRTAEDSEAVIAFGDGLNLELQQNTMLRLTMRGEERNVDFTEGSVTLSGGGTGSVSLGDTGRKLTLSSDAMILVTKTSDTMSLELSQGTATVSGETGDQSLSPTQALDIAKSGDATVRTIAIVPKLPAPGARLVDQSAGAPVVFAYQSSSSEDLRVEVSDSPDFVALRRADSQSKGAASLVLEPGTWYWRVSGAGAQSAVRQFTLTREEPPSPSFPLDRAEIAYRKKLPSVAFSWTARELATDWTFELSRSADFKAPQLRKRTGLSSLSVDGIEAGVWYWRVVPRYQATLVSAPVSPIARTFSVVQRQAMAAVVPSLPLDGTTVETQELSAKGIAFTWDPVPEAREYELAAVKSRDPGAPVLAKFTTNNPYLLLTPEQLGVLTKEGRTYWTLRWKDDEANLSPAGKPRTLNAVDGTVALRPTYPPDGYQIADQYLSNTRFSWKSNLALETVFQVSRTPDFAEIVHQEPARDGTLLAKNWGTGTLYWRLSSINPNGSVFLQTDPRRFEVVAPFGPVRLSEPQSGTTLLLPAGVGTTLVWPAVPGVDYYDVALLGPSEQHARVEQRPDEPNRLDIPLGDWAEGAYQVRIQAFRRESAASTAVIGLYGETALISKRLVLPTLVQPEAGLVVDGLEAWRHGLAFRWESATPAPDARIELRKEDGSLVSLTGPASVARQFPAGNYRWTVAGSYNGYDLTPPQASFTVTPIPPLDTISGQLPAPGKVFGIPELKAMKTLDLSWDPIPLAAEYVVRLFFEQEPNAVYQTTLKDTHLSLAKKDVLKRGAFTWDVQAHTLGDDGLVEQQSPRASAAFTIDIPVIAAPTVPEGSTYYGR